MSDSFDIIAIGGGTAGLVTVAGAAYLGARAALIERERLGGDCLWTGCVPSKALVASAHAAQARRDSGELGLPGKAKPVDFGLVMDAMRRARDTVSPHDDPARFRAMGIEVVEGPAEFCAPDTVRVGDRVLRSRRIVIATGSRPSIPPIPGLTEAGFHTHQTILDLTEAPASVAIVGAGPIGVEFAQIFQRLGVPVALFEVAGEILAREDPEAAAVVRKALEREGVTVHLGARIARIEREGVGKAVVWRQDDGPELVTRVGSILVAAGRSANIEGLGLAYAGVRSSPAGVEVNRYLRTSVRGIWAAGDVTGGPQYTHMADYQAKLVVRNSLVPLFRARASYRTVPRVTFSDPELAQVGLLESEARAAGGEVAVWRYDLADLDRAITDRRRDGFVKLVADGKGKLLGATIAGASAGDLIALIVLAMERRLRVSALASFIYPYPTMSEGILRAANQQRRARLDTPSGRWLKRLVQWGL
jgi:pyruvate/2-oxoglutarate dehydrogenase complex dihydrolipoamide dehydrogenase (E3) component